MWRSLPLPIPATQRGSHCYGLLDKVFYILICALRNECVYFWILFYKNGTMWCILFTCFIQEILPYVCLRVYTYSILSYFQWLNDVPCPHRVLAHYYPGRLDSLEGLLSDGHFSGLSSFSYLFPCEVSRSAIWVKGSNWKSLLDYQVLFRKSVTVYIPTVMRMTFNLTLGIAN